MKARLLGVITMGWALSAAAGCAKPASPAAAPAPARAAEVRGPIQEGMLLYRKAETFRARQRAVFVQLFVIDEAERSGAGGARAARRREVLEAEAARWREEAIAAYTALVDAPDQQAFPWRPTALLALAQALEDSGDADTAERRYEQLVDEHPHADAAAEAYLALANAAFAAERLEEAASLCDGALRYPGAARRKRALYLKAWSLRGLGGAYDEAMEALREIVRMGPSSAGSLESRIDEAAERELVDMYARHGDLDRAGAFFASAGEQAAVRLLDQVRARSAGTRRLERLDRPTY